jgi:putative hemolysin
VGVFDEAEQDIVQSVFRLGDRRVDSIMTPRTEMFWLDMDAPLEEISRKQSKASTRCCPSQKATWTTCRAF